MNHEYIHPLKQEDVQAIVDRLSENQDVRRIVIFGSSVDIRCASASDIDVYVETCHPGEHPAFDYTGVSSEVDFVYDVLGTSSLYREIDRDGIVVFERGL